MHVASAADRVNLELSCRVKEENRISGKSNLGAILQMLSFSYALNSDPKNL